MMRGGKMRGMGRPPMGFKSAMKPFIPHIPFDPIVHSCFQGEQAFPRVKPNVEETDLTNALIERNTQLTPTAPMQTAILNLVTRISGILDTIMLAPGNFEAAQIEEFRQVGSFKKGTMMRKNNVADLVVTLRTLPTREAVSQLSKKVIDDLKTQNPREALTLFPKPSGFEISSRDASVRVLISTIPPNLKRLDPTLHLDGKLMMQHMAAVRHARWFEENAQHTTVKVLIRLVRDLQQRFPGLVHMSPWIVDLLCQFAVMKTPSMQPLAINVAFRRVLQLLSAGLFLPGSLGIPDPCEGGQRCHTVMSLEEQDEVCFTAQTLLRVLAHGGYRQVLGLDGNASEIVSEMSVLNGIVVSPSTKVYEKHDEEVVPENTENEEPMPEAAPVKQEEVEV